jgi:hypothetical protein
MHAVEQLRAPGLASLLAMVALGCADARLQRAHEGEAMSVAPAAYVSQRAAIDREEPPQILSLPPTHLSEDVEETSDDLLFAVVSDMNGRYGSTSYRRDVTGAVDFLTERLSPDVVISTGDHVAGQRHGLDYPAMWEAFHTTFTERLADASIPFAMTPGNHDAYPSEAYSVERETYVAQWAKRRPDVDFVDDTHYPLYYAFRRGPALFVSLDAASVGPLDDRQRAWLDRVLDRERDAPIKVVFGHVPLHPFAEVKKSEILDDRKLEKLLVRHDVDLLLSGHHHVFYPGRRAGVRMVGMSCLGGGNRALVGREDPGHRSVLVVRVEDERIVSLEAWRGPDFSKTIDRATLPRSINSGRHRLYRDDVRDEVDRMVAAVAAD